eukprot:g5419.t1
MSGQYTNQVGQVQCAVCVSGKISATGDDGCTVCPAGVECALGSIAQRGGWWRAEAGGKTPGDAVQAAAGGTLAGALYECFNEACRGSGAEANEGAGEGEDEDAGGGEAPTVERKMPAFDEQCEEGYTGPVCALCEPGYTRQGGECTYCPGFDAQNVAGVVIVVLAVIALAVLFYRHRRAAWMQPTVLSITLTFFEMISILDETFNVKWPAGYSSLTSHIRAAFASFVELSALSCAAHIDRFAHLAIWTLGMLAVLALVYAHYRYAATAAPRGDAPVSTSDEPRQKWIRHSFYVLFYCYPLVSPVVISIFICRTIDDTPYLVADYTLHCEGKEWALATVWAALWTVSYVVGFPLLMWRALHQRWGVVQFVAADFKHTGVARYWPIIDFAKKLFLSSLVLFFPEGTSTRISLAVLVAATVLAMLLWYRPFHHSIHNRLDFAASSALVLTYFTGLMLQVHPALSQEHAFSAILVVLVVGVAIAALVAFRLARHGVLEATRGGKLDGTAHSTHLATPRASHAGASKAATENPVHAASGSGSGSDMSLHVENPAYDDASSGAGTLTDAPPNASEEDPLPASSAPAVEQSVAELKAELARTKQARGEYAAARVAVAVEEERVRAAAQLEEERKHAAAGTARQEQLARELAELKAKLQGAERQKRKPDYA